MATAIFDAEVTQILQQAQLRASTGSTKNVIVDGQSRTIPSPFPSPTDWRDCWIYFLMTDRFNNSTATPEFAWNQKYGFRQGGTFEGVRQQLSYLRDLGVRAIWLSPIVKNPRPAGFEYTYPGYDAQDFLNLDERFGSDGTRATAERELVALVDEAHARGIYVIVDIVLNHAGRVFDYLYHGSLTDSFGDQSVIGAPLGQEPPIEWINGFGFPRSDWLDNLPNAASLSVDDAVWPVDLQRKEFFRRRGASLSNEPGPGGFIPGDFGTLRQLVAEYDATVPGQDQLRLQYGVMPVLSILIRAYEYLMAKYDIDGFRIDTVKYVRSSVIETFGNAIREYALSIGKANFFTFGEIYDSEDLINKFIGRNGSDTEGFGIDAALDFPLFYQLPSVVKAFNNAGVETIRAVFEKRKQAEQGLISSHGDAGRYFVSFLDNHDQQQRFNHPATAPLQVSLGLAVLFCLQGIPCVYYGTEQGLQGTVDSAGNPTLDSLESVREALWGKQPLAFDQGNPIFQQLHAIAMLRTAEPALRYGRLYFREVSGNRQDFGQSSGVGGILAFSRILTDHEIVVVANTNFTQPFNGLVLVDFDLSQQQRNLTIAYSNRARSGSVTVQVALGHIGNATQPIASIPVSLEPMEVQVFVPT